MHVQVIWKSELICLLLWPLLGIETTTERNRYSQMHGNTKLHKYCSAKYLFNEMRANKAKWICICPAYEKPTMECVNITPWSIIFPQFKASGQILRMQGKQGLILLFMVLSTVEIIPHLPGGNQTHTRNNIVNSVKKNNYILVFNISFFRAKKKAIIIEDVGMRMFSLCQ